MTQALNQAIKKLSQLPETSQDQWANLILKEMEEDQKWQDTTDRHPEAVKRLIAQVTEEDESGNTEQLDPEKL